jgi:alpha-glucosidase (family GH31 glycosyl hydrolase)
MNGIRHLPYGTDPYASCGYDRIPLHPSEGQPVTVRCTAEDGAEPPVLELYMDVGKQELAGTPDPEYGKGCFRFSFGPFHAGERVRYRIAAGENRTDFFPFTVRQVNPFERFGNVWAEPDAVSLSCCFQGGYQLALKVSRKDNGFLVTPVGTEAAANGGGSAELRLPGGFRFAFASFGARVELLGPDGAALLSFRGASLELEGDRAVRLHLNLWAKGRGFYGFGEKFDRVNQKGLKPKNIVYEHFTRQGEHTYFPVPWIFTEAGWGMYWASDCAADFDLSRKQDSSAELEMNAEIGPEGLPAFYVLTGSPAELLGGFQKLTGPCALPPEWAFGPWISANGWNTQQEALEQVRRMKQEKIPATVMVLEAWSDETTFYIFNGAHYQPKLGGVFHYSNFSFDPDGPWPDPKRMTEILRENGLHLVLWQIPALKNAAENSSEQLQLDEREAVENGYCVKNADGTPYRIPERWFSGSLVPDFTNPKASEWWLEKRRYLVKELHVEGFKTDGGEFIYDPDTRFFNGKTGAEMRNPYPAAYSAAYYRFLQAAGHGGITFSRAGYAGAQKSPLHWAGDQISTFGEMRSQLRAGLSVGLSGVPFWGFDLAGFAGDLPDTELYLRGAEMAAFSPVMQFHSEPRSGQFGDNRRRSFINDRSPWNMAKVNDAPEIISVYRDYANLRMKLLPYIWKEAQNCAATGRPLLCHLVYDYPGDENVLNLEDEYLFGRELLVAPVLEEGARKRRVYLPAGEWRDYWTGDELTGGRIVEVPCPIDRIPVFRRGRFPVYFPAEHMASD